MAQNTILYQIDIQTLHERNCVTFMALQLLNYYYSGVYKSLAPGFEGDQVLYVGVQYL